MRQGLTLFAKLHALPLLECRDSGMRLGPVESRIYPWGKRDLQAEGPGVEIVKDLQELQILIPGVMPQPTLENIFFN